MSTIQSNRQEKNAKNHVKLTQKLQWIWKMSYCILKPTILLPTEMKPRNVQQREKTGQEKREKGEERKHKEKFGLLPMPKIQNGMFARNKEQRNA